MCANTSPGSKSTSRPTLRKGITLAACQARIVRSQRGGLKCAPRTRALTKRGDVFNCIDITQGATSTCPTCRVKIARITKSDAARTLAISRRTVYRYAKAGLVSEDRRRRVLLSEVKKIWEGESRAGHRYHSRPQAFRFVSGGRAYEMAKKQYPLSEARLLLRLAKKSQAKGARRLWFRAMLRQHARELYWREMERPRKTSAPPPS